MRRRIARGSEFLRLYRNARNAVGLRVLRLLLISWTNTSSPRTWKIRATS